MSNADVTASGLISRERITLCITWEGTTEAMGCHCFVRMDYDCQILRSLAHCLHAAFHVGYY